MVATGTVGKYKTKQNKIILGAYFIEYIVSYQNIYHLPISAIEDYII